MEPVNGGRHGGEQEDQPVPQTQQEACRVELSDFMQEVLAGRVRPINMVIVFQSEDGAYGFRGNDNGSGLMQVGLLEAAKAVILSRSIGGRPAGQVQS